MSALFLAFLHSTAFSDDSTCLDKSTKKGGTAYAAFSAEGRWLAALTKNEVILWEFATKKKAATLAKPHGAFLDELAFSPDGQCIVYLDIAGRVGLWDGSTGWEDAKEREILGPVLGPSGEPKSMGGEITISPDGTQVAVYRDKNVINIVDIDTGKDIAELDVGRPANSLQYADQGKVLVVGIPGSKRDNPLVQFWDMEAFTAGEPLLLRNPPRDKVGSCTFAVLSPTDEVLSANVGNLNFSSEIRLYELPSRRWATLANNIRIMPHLSFSPDGRLLAVPTHHGPSDAAAVLVWDLRARTWRRFDCPSKIAQQNIAFWNTTFSPDGRYLVGGLTHPEVAVCIWDLQAEEETSESD